MKKIIIFLFFMVYVTFLITNEFIQQAPPVYHKKESRNSLLQNIGELLMSTMQKTIQTMQSVAKIQEKIFTISCNAINQEYEKNLSNPDLSSKRDKLKAIDSDIAMVMHHLKNIEQRLQQL